MRLSCSRFAPLPLVILISALSAVLYHFRVLPWVVQGFAWVLGKTLRISGAASFSTAANVFVGMVEAPLLVRPYLARMSRSELFVVMTAGMAGIDGERCAGSICQRLRAKTSSARLRLMHVDPRRRRCWPCLTVLAVVIAAG